MVRVITQILLGLMLSFGAVTLSGRVVAYLRQKNYLKTSCLLILAAIALFFTVMSFSYAYFGIRGLWK